MNELELKSELHGAEGDDKLLVVTALYVDGEAVADFGGYATFLEELERSTLSGGNFFILTCWCGSPQCAGIYQAVQVYHEADTIRWVWSQPEPQRTFVFDAAAYKKAIEIGITQIRREVKDLWIPDVEYKDQQLEIVPDFDISLLTPKVNSKAKHRHNKNRQALE